MTGCSGRCDGGGNAAPLTDTDWHLDWQLQNHIIIDNRGGVLRSEGEGQRGMSIPVLDRCIIPGHNSIPQFHNSTILGGIPPKRSFLHSLGRSGHSTVGGVCRGKSTAKFEAQGLRQLLRTSMHVAGGNASSDSSSLVHHHPQTLRAPRGRKQRKSRG